MIIFIRASPGLVLIAALALIFGRIGRIGGIGAMAFAVMLALLVVVVLAVVATGWYLVRRLRLAPNPSPKGLIRIAPVRELSGDEQPAIPQQHLHLHFGPGSDPAAVAEILRSSEGKRGGEREP